MALKPYSNTTFKISNLALPIQDSQGYYTLNATGTGGLNDFDISYGYRIGKKLALGIATTVLFGNTTDERDYSISNSITNSTKKTNYSGVRASLGAQFKVDSTFTLGMNLKSPTKVNATRVQSVTTVNNSGTVTIESELESDTDDYYMPLEIGVGLSKLFRNN
ncbi:hypothetical protein [Flavobacterium sp. XS2P39]|uniref:hypothetical protein n=1 Tax=Flavobacterium sp. XS2P39 TaxID=3401725 RepID=UPI003AAAF648